MHRCHTLYSELSLSEISGSFGDIGTFIPLFVALGRQRAIHVTPALFFAGLTNAVTGFFWDVPMPVQPMKSIAAAGIAGSLTQNQVTAAGIWMGIFMTLLGATNGIEWVNRIVPAAVVAGMQLGVGLSLAIHGVQMVVELSFVGAPDCILTAIIAGIVTYYFLRQQQQPAETTTTTPNEDSERNRRRRSLPPVGLYLLGVALILAIVKMVSNDTTTTTTSEENRWTWEPIAEWTIPHISQKDWLGGLLEGAIPQLPLTTLNSVISVCALAHSLFPEKRRARALTTTNTAAAGEETESSSDDVLSRREVAFSVGLLNLVACPFGAMPNCHGAGGLAGQHKLGARHGASIVFLGCLKMILAITLGVAVVDLMDAFPLSILGVMLTMAGQELALTGLMLSLRHFVGGTTNGSPSVELRDRVSVAILTSIVILGTKKTHYGAIAGWICHWVFHASRNNLNCFNFWRGTASRPEDTSATEGNNLPSIS